MKAYLDLLRHVRDSGVRKPTRAILASTGEHVDALSVFGAQIRFDLADGFPATTTKRLAFATMASELAWFLRGETNVRSLQAEGVRIWDQWADENGDLGPVYGSQWRSWQCPDGRVIDQIANVVAGIREVITNPTASVGRRLLVSAWNTADIETARLPPCHVMFQFSVTRGKLSCQLYQRSADLLLGVPFNIASYALLTHLIAHVTGLEAGEFIHTFGDVHIYANHLEQVAEQLSREPMALPVLSIRPGFDDLAAFHRSDVALIGYAHHAAIQAEVAV